MTHTPNGRGNGSRAAPASRDPTLTLFVPFLVPAVFPNATRPEGKDGTKLLGAPSAWYSPAKCFVRSSRGRLCIASRWRSGGVRRQQATSPHRDQARWAPEANY